jgi:diguanylate cyclase (GGDEF)-like protein
LFAVLTPKQPILYQNLLLLLAVTSVSIFSGRYPTLLMIAIATSSRIILRHDSLNTFLDWTNHLAIPAIAIILNETAVRTQEASRRQIHRLEIINAFSRQVAATLDREQILERLNAAIPNALSFDSYYVSLVENEEIHFLLCYDDGEYFNGLRAPAEGTFTNWVVQNQRELFLPDLRQPIDLEGIKMILVGKEKTSLSWIGVPMTSNSLKGVLALASYQPNAFNRGDLELLSSLAQHTALALENATRHAEVEERARLDSLTGVFNHGYFLELLKKQTGEALNTGNHLSLIMLDVDYFKHYNDTYGHLAGDKILTALCNTIRSHIKNTDAVGRWGGEEFCISLPNAETAHARVVATRISNSMRELKISDRDGRTIPAPTVSQGVAIFPLETDEIFKLIDIADRRLYTAKERGRDQIEAPHA